MKKILLLLILVICLFAPTMVKASEPLIFETTMVTQEITEQPIFYWPMPEETVVRAVLIIRARDTMNPTKNYTARLEKSFERTLGQNVTAFDAPWINGQAIS